MSREPIFVDTPSSHLYCSLCEAILRDPVISVACGHTFCRSCLCQSDGSVKVANCPVDKEFIQDSPVVDNRAILSQVEDLRVYCRNGIRRLNSRNDTVLVENGCPEIIPFSSVEEHDCKYGVIECPNSTLCGKFRKVELADHLSDSCPYVNCPNRGCSSRGTDAEIREHQRDCPHFATKINGATGDLDTVADLQAKVHVLEQSKMQMETCLQEQSSIIETLQQRLSSLEKDVQTNKKRLDVSSRPRTGSSSLSYSRFTSLSSSFDGSASSRQQWHLPFEFKCIGTLRGHKGPVHCLAIKGDKLYSGGTDCVIKVWNLYGLSKGCIQELRGHTKQVVSLVAGPRYLYSTSLDHTIRCWQYENNNFDVRKVQTAHEEDICALIMSTNLLFSSSKSEVKIWKADTLELVKVISGLHHWVRALAMDPHEELLYCGAHNTVTVWDATGQFNLKRKLDHAFGSVYAIVVSHQFLIVGTYNQNIHVFDVRSYQHLHTSLEHIGPVSALQLSPDMNFLISGCYDLKVRIYHLENFLSVQVLSRHYGSVNCLAMKNSKGLLCSGSDDHEIKIYTYFPLTTHSSYGSHVRLLGTNSQ